MINDLQTRKNRMAKKMGDEHFKPQLDDDSFGFGNSPFNPETKLSIVEKVFYTLVFAYFAWFAFEAVVFIFTNLTIN